MSMLHLILERQWLHALLLVLLLIGVALSSNLDGRQTGMLWGISTTLWFRLAIASAIAHQVFVWFCWRTQLHGRLLDRLFGNLSYPLYASFFFILGSLRVLSVFALAIANRDTLAANIILLRIAAVIALAASAYVLYSVLCYFSLQRASGIDHFDERYRSKPLVREGIFRYSRNSMYTYGFLFFWVPALWCASTAALCAALFNHIYIWVHYYTTELPDMKRIYGENQLTTRD
jgi:protein-S-isoprenylcysteine O-methyltransferase Ste14